MLKKIMIRLLVITFITTCIVGTFAPNIYANDRPIQVILNGKVLSFEEPPIIQDGHTFVPMRDIVEALGADLSWNNEERKVTASVRNKLIQLQIDNPIATINGNAIRLNAPAKLINGKTMIPLRFIAESTGATVDWNGETNSVYISYVLDTQDKNIDTIKIGANFELTGGQARFGISSIKGVYLAVKEINTADGVLGKQLEIITEDNASKSEESTRAVRKLITNDKVVALIGPVTSTNTLGAVPVAQEKKVPLITPSATNPKVTVNAYTGKVNDYVFRTCFIDPYQGKVGADFASKELKAKTAAIYMDASSEYSKGLQKLFKETFVKNGGTIVSEDSYYQEDTDFKAILTRIKEKTPDFIYVPGYYQEAGNIIKQAREMGITAPIMGGDGWDTPRLFEIAGNAALNNTFMSNHYAADETSDEIQKFVTAYKKEYYNETPDALAALSYDAVKLLADAIKRANSTEPEKIKDALAVTNDAKLATGVVTMNETHDPVKSAVVLEFKDGKQVFKTRINP